MHTFPMAQRPRSPVAPPPEECYVHRDLLSAVLRAARFTGGASAGGSAGGHAAVRFRRAVLLRSEKEQDSETQQRDDSRAELGEKPAPNGTSCVTVPGETWGGARGARASPRAPLAVTGAGSRGRCEHRRAPRSAPGRVRPPPCAWTSPRATRVGARGPVTEAGRTRRALGFPGRSQGRGCSFLYCRAESYP